VHIETAMFWTVMGRLVHAEITHPRGPQSLHPDSERTSNILSEQIEFEPIECNDIWKCIRRNTVHRNLYAGG
jgi:hypothetical protein